MNSEPLPVGDVVETDWGQWDDSVAFQDTYMSGFGPDADSLVDSLAGDPSAIVVEVGPEDTEHFDPFTPHPPKKP